jgi:opacity protein-like surface antigen
VQPLKKILTLRHHAYFYRMKQYVLTVLALLLIGMPVLAQETAGQTTTTTTQQRETFQPNVRGSLLFAVGVNVLQDAPEQFNLKTWGSKSVNIYYLYDVNIGASRISFHPGIGLGLEKYEIESPVTPVFRETVTGISEPGPILIMDSLQFVYGTGLYKKNRLSANYIDVPLEFSWVSNKTNPKAGFKVTLGGKAGVLFGSQMKIKYTVGDDTRKDKLKRDWNLNPFRYSAHARVGYSAFNLYVEYQLSDLFDAGEGPYYRTRRNNTTAGTAPFVAFPEGIRNLRFGLAIDLF